MLATLVFWIGFVLCVCFAPFADYLLEDASPVEILCPLNLNEPLKLSKLSFFKDQHLQPTAKTLKHPSLRWFEGESQIQELFHEYLGIKYSFAVLRGEEFDSAKFVLMPHIEKLDSSHLTYLEQVRSDYKAPVYVKWLGDHLGYGLFAAEDIPAGGYIACYAGELRLKKDLVDLSWAWPYPMGVYDESLDILEVLVIDGKYIGNELRFVNHSEWPTASVKYAYDPDRKIWDIIYVAKVRIRAHKQITVNYGSCFWSKTKKLKLDI